MQLHFPARSKSRFIPTDPNYIVYVVGIPSNEHGAPVDSASLCEGVDERIILDYFLTCTQYNQVTEF